MLDEADMSRRDFLKVTGKAAAGAAAPKSLLKGLLPSAEKAKGLVLPKNQAEMVTALLKWAKESGHYQDWYNKCVTWYSSPHSYWFDKNKPSKEEVHQKAVKRIQEWADYTSWAPTQKATGDHPEDSPDPWQLMNWVLWNGKHFQDDPGLPEWVTAYRVSQWAGKDIGLDHPLVKDREKWDKVFDKIHYGRIDNQALIDEFKSIVQSTLPQNVAQEIVNDIKPFITSKPQEPEPEWVDDDEGDPDKQPEPEAQQEEQPSQIPTDEPDAWRTQSVEFENKLRRLVR